MDKGGVYWVMVLCKMFWIEPTCYYRLRLDLPCFQSQTELQILLRLCKRLGKLCRSRGHRYLSLCAGPKTEQVC